MSSSDEEKALLLLAIAEDEKPKKMWVCDINKERLQKDFFQMFFQIYPSS